MNFLPVFSAWQFAAAGLACATIPVVIHLLNRRRFRIVPWGAMQFLREAVQQKRQIMRLRDILLLLLRVAAVACFGLALSQPYFAVRSQSLDAGQPVHAVLLIDNSLSMAYETLGGSTLDAAKKRAVATIDRLPNGSRISVLPLGGTQDSTSIEPFDTKPLAIEAVQRIQAVDRSMTVRQAIDESRRAAQATTNLPARCVLFSDQQLRNWTDLTSLQSEAEVPSIQIVQVAIPERGNSWVDDLQIQDGLADSQTPATLRARLRHHGAQPRHDVRVALSVNDVEVASQIVHFNETDSTREVTFSYVFREFQPLPNQPSFVPVRITLAPDRLALDDERHLMVPVVAALPVVFVDQYGAQQENPTVGRLGETRHLRQLLAPTDSGDRSQQLVKIHHITIDELDRDALANTRLIVIAGIATPADKIDLLRRYVEQGGQLVIAAGGSFDAAAWNSAGWLDGRGILPAPLLHDPIGSLPDETTGELRPLFLSFESLGNHPYFELAGNSEQDLRDLYAEPFFFKAVQVNLAAAATLKPKVLARFTSERGPPFLIEAQIGAGKVLLVTSAVLSNWNTLPKTNAMVIFDRILRDMIESTLPSRNYGPVQEIAISIADEVRDAEIVLRRPDKQSAAEPLDTGFVTEDEFGVVIDRPLTRGVYQLATAGSSPDQPPRWEFQVAVNGAADESDLTSLDENSFQAQFADQAFNWVRQDVEVSLAGAGIRGQDIWWWLALGVLIIMFAELTLLWTKR